MTANERRMALLEVLCLRRHDTRENLAFEFGVSKRTIEYDVEILSADYPIYSVQGKGGGIFIMEERYNRIMQAAPARYYDLYIGLYVNGYTQEAYAEEMGYCPQHICVMNRNLIKFIQKQFEQ